MEDLLQALRSFGEEYGGRAVGALLLLAAGWLANRYLVVPLRRVLARSRVDPSAASFLVNTARSVLVVAVVLGVLHQLGVAATSLLTLLGAAALAVALALQGSLANFASGLVVLSFRLVRVGDWVEAGDVRGRVAELLPFHVVVVTADNQRVTVPNTNLAGGVVRNHSALPTRRAEWVLPLPAGDDLAAAREALRARLRADRRILAEPAPEVYVKEWAADKRLLTVTAWTATADQPAVQQELLEALGLALEGLRPPQAPAAR
jgi:small conductance mechanosensitive channel